MKFIINKIIYTIGIITILLLAYAFSFHIVANNIVYPFERDHFMELSPIRGTYNIIYYPLRWLKANGVSLKSEEIEEYYGWLRESEIEKDELEMRTATLEEFEGATIYIGFTGNNELLENFDTLNKDQFVLLTFGTALSKKSDSLINKLVSYKKITLPPDPRMKTVDLSEQESEDLFRKYNELSGEAKNCAETFLKKYEDKVLEHCALAGYAKNIGGGCHHVAGALSSGAVKGALSACNAKI